MSVSPPSGAGGLRRIVLSVSAEVNPATLRGWRIAQGKIFLGGGIREWVESGKVDGKVVKPRQRPTAILTKRNIIWYKALVKVRQERRR